MVHSMRWVGNNGTWLVAHAALPGRDIARFVAIMLGAALGGSACNPPPPAELLAAATHELRSCRAGRACDDGNACTVNDVCNSRSTCVGTAYRCDDGDPCTADACDGLGGCSHTPVATCAPARLAAPTLAGARPDSGGVEITWLDAATNEDGFRLERSTDAGATWTAVRTLPANATFTDDHGIPLEQVACYRLLAFNAQGDSPPSQPRCTARPTTPTGVSAAVAGDGIDVTWTDASTVEDGYEVERTDGLVAFAVVARLPADTTTYHDVVPRDVTYRYKVRAVRDGGGSEYAGFVTAAIGTVAPAAPTGTRAVPAGSTSVGILWTDASTNESGFRVERSPDGEGSWETVGTTTYADPYPLLDHGRTAEVRVCYRAIAVNDAGDSPPSPVACTTPPAAPTHLAVTVVPEGVRVTWTDNSAVEDSYYIAIMTDCGESPIWGEEAPANATSFVDTYGSWCFGPAIGYEVAIQKDGGWSDFASIASPYSPP
jgi:hypothetical protein